MIYQLTYKSHVSYTPSLIDLDQLLQRARLNNELASITGCLVFFEQRFYQILEGEESMVKNLFKKIQEDSRHNEVELVIEGESDKRLFPDWGMLFHNVDETVQSNEELEQFRRNVFLLTGLMNTRTKTEYSFWHSIRNAIF